MSERKNRRTVISVTRVRVLPLGKRLHVLPRRVETAAWRERDSVPELRITPGQVANCLFL